MQKPRLGLWLTFLLVISGLVLRSNRRHLIRIHDASLELGVESIVPSSSVGVTLNCGCPTTCDAATLARRSPELGYSCRERIEYLMRVNNKTQSQACWSAVQTKACTPKCNPTNCSTVGDEHDQHGPPRPHPHAGARDSFGNWNYVEDVGRVRRWMLSRYKQEKMMSTANNETAPLSFMPAQDISGHICNHTLGKGYESEAWNLLTKIQVNGLNNATTTVHESNPSKGKILCAIYTHEGGHERLLAIQETWGWHCDGFLAASTKTTNEPPFAVDLPHLGEERYGNMFQKSRSILAYAHDNYMSEFDYLYLCGDDTHLIVENLRLYLGEVEATNGKEAPLFAGQLVPGKHFTKREPLVIGGGGYVVNRCALEMFVKHANKKECFPSKKSPAEDRFVSRCFTNIGIMASDAADQEGAQRFHSVNPATLLRLHQLKARKPRDTWNGARNLWEQQGHGRKVGIDLASVWSISFHFLRNPAFMKCHHVILYRSCPMDTILGQQLALVDTDTTKAQQE